jgi:serine/threonine protein kinase
MLVFFFLIICLRTLFPFPDELGDLLGDDTFAYVCSAFDVETKEKIAIKFFKQQANDSCINQEIIVGFDKRLICPYIMTFISDFVFGNEETKGDFRCVSMELMSGSLECLESSKPPEGPYLKNLLRDDISVYFILCFVMYMYVCVYHFIFLEGDVLIHSNCIGDCCFSSF